MALSFSSYLKNLWLATNTGVGLGALLTGATGGTGAQLEICSGPVPATADTVYAGTVLATIDTPTTHLLFVEPCVNGILNKTGVWSTTSVTASGTATFFRLHKYGVTTWNSGPSLVAVVQGTITDATGSGDLILATTVLVAGNALTIDVFQIGLP